MNGGKGTSKACHRDSPSGCRQIGPSHPGVDGHGSAVRVDVHQETPRLAGEETRHGGGTGSSDTGYTRNHRATHRRSIG